MAALVYVAFLSNNSSVEQGKEIRAAQKIASIWRNASSGAEIQREIIRQEEYGETAPAVAFTQDLYLDVNSAVTELRTKFETAKLDKLLSQETLENPDNISAAVSSTQSIIEVIDKTELKLNNLMNEYMSKAQKLDLPKDFKKGFIQGLTATKDGSIAQIKGFYVIERKILNQAVEILQFMHALQGRYTFVDGSAMFATNEDMDTYNQMILDLQEFADEETIYKNDLQKKNQSNFNEYEKAFRDYLK